MNEATEAVGGKKVMKKHFDKFKTKEISNFLQGHQFSALSV